MQLSPLTMLIASAAMLSSAVIINARMKASLSGGTMQSHLMKMYFFCMGIFCFFMFLPHLIRAMHPEQFPLAMAWGYTIGHIFCYAGFAYILRLTFSMIPRLNNKDRLAVVLGAVINVALTVLTTVTMVFGTRPEFDADKGVTLFHAHPAVGAGIIIYALVAVVPAALLMLYNGFTNPTARVRSFLLGGGFLVSMIAGPMHDNASSATVYMIADIITIISVLITTSGVLYRLDEKISVSPAAVPAR